MKRNRGTLFLSIFLLGFAIAVLGQDFAHGHHGSPANLQTVTFNVHVPFSFAVGSQTLPAGFYQVQRLLGRPTPSDLSGMIVLRGITVPAYLVVPTQLVPPSPVADGRSQLLFGSQQGRHYLSQVRIAGEKGEQIPNVSAGTESAQFNAPPQELVLAELSR